jgi:CRP/FNR family transcriptional regulator, anaerobic regulatory protein
MTWTQSFAELASLPAETAAELVARSRVVHLPAGARVFEAGQRAQNMLLLLNGSVRVQQISETGREVFLYRVHAGESCVLTTACMLADEDYAAEGIAETDIEAVAIPRATFDDLTGRSSQFRSFVFRAYSRRIADLFALIDDIIFQRMDVRLAERLLQLEQDGIVHATHQALSVELGTAREVVSRTLAEFQRRGWVETARGEIRILGREGLLHLAHAAT